MKQRGARRKLQKFTFSTFKIVNNGMTINWGQKIANIGNLTES